MKDERIAALYEPVLNSFRDPITIINRSYVYEAANEAYCKVLGRKREEILGRKVSELWGEEIFQTIIKLLLDRCLAGSVVRDEARFESGEGQLRCFEITYTPVPDSPARITHAMVVSRDITEHKNLEEQFLQAQKMEAMGRLASGIAHDFNNLLAVITGYAQIRLMNLPADAPQRSDIREIEQAGLRAASLTSQLLTFARRELFEPTVVNLSQLILNMNKMLQRLMRADVEVVTLPNQDLWRIKADPSHLEQVVMNLSVNARDAMAQGGKLTITTDNVAVEAESAPEHPEVPPGEYVLLSVNDTGCGMTEEVKARIFEPFFTTKEKGKGTGLGLATSYGIVKQSGGTFVIVSEPGRGTTFKIYFPRTEERADEGPAEQAKKLPQGTETLLLVEDDQALRSLSARVLKEQGYQVIEAATGTDALRLAEGASGKAIKLLFADIVLPQIGGLELAAQITKKRPDIKVLFTSGYHEHAMSETDARAANASFIEKPFWPAALVLKVRAVLDT